MSTDSKLMTVEKSKGETPQIPIETNKKKIVYIFLCNKLTWIK